MSTKTKITAPAQADPRKKASTSANRPRPKASVAKAPAEDPKTQPSASPAAKITRADALIAMMRAEGGASAQEMACAIGWQIHSVRGFIAGTLKKRSDLVVTTVKTNGATRYQVKDARGAAA